MVSRNKVDRMSIRVSPDQKRRAAIAAAIVSRRKGETVAPGTLLRDLAMPSIDKIIEDEGRAADQAA